MAMNYTVSDGKGTVGQVSSQEVAQQFAKAGQPVAGMTPDGANLIMQDHEGQFQVPIHKAVQQLGWQVSRMEPANADYGNVDPGLRAMVTTMPEHMKPALIKAEMENRGIQNPTIVGGGRDWFVFNPQTNQYVALTNDPHSFGMGDVAEGAIEGGRGLASALGATGGAALGGGTPASIALGAGGAALGSSVMDAGTKGLLSLVDPTYRKLAEEHLGDMAWDTGGKALMDAAAGGIGVGAPKALGALAKGMEPGMGRMLARGAQGLAEQGPASRMAQATGGAMQTAGDIAEGVGGFLRKPGISDAINTGDPTGMLYGGLPISGDLSGLGYMTRFAAEDAPEAAMRGVGYLGEKTGSQRLTNFANAATRERPGVNGAEESYAAGSGPAIYGNATEGGMNAFRSLTTSATKRKAVEDYLDAQSFMPQGHQWAPATEELAKRARAKIIGNKVAGFAKGTGNLGRGMIKAGEGLYDVGMGAVQHAGGMTSAAGRTVEGLGNQAAPLENQLYLHYGTEEGLGPWNRSAPSLRRGARGSIEPTLAQAY